DGGCIEDLVHPVATDLVGSRSRDVEALRVEVAHPRQIDTRSFDVADEPERARIELDDLEQAVALVELELDHEDAAIARGGEERPERRHRRRDILEWDRHVAARIGKSRWLHANASSGVEGADLAMPIDEAIDDERVRHPARDVLLEHERDAVCASLLDQTHGVLSRLDEEAFRLESTVVGLRLG